MVRGGGIVQPICSIMKILWILTVYASVERILLASSSPYSGSKQSAMKQLPMSYLFFCLHCSLCFHSEPSFTTLSHCGYPDGEDYWAILCRFTPVGIYGCQGEPNCALQLLWKWNRRRFFIRKLKRMVHIERIYTDVSYLLASCPPSHSPAFIQEG